MSEQEKREAGASRKAIKRPRIDITLSQEVLDYLDSHEMSRSRFLEKLVTESIEFKQWQEVKRELAKHL